MDIQEILKQVENYRENGRSWCELASIILEVNRKEEWRSDFKSAADWVKQVAKTSGYHPGIIRRMIKVKQFLDRMVSQDIIEIKPGENVPLASVEILERMYPLSPEKVKELFGKALSGEMTLKQVQREYDQVVAQEPSKVSDAKLLPRMAYAFTQRAGMAVKKYYSCSNWGYFTTHLHGDIKKDEVTLMRAIYKDDEYKIASKLKTMVRNGIKKKCTELYFIKC